ncbi:hypothetical protein [Desulfolucanica intricata]|uniref:prenylated flavin chaperone LpdD n=1 Tax=Desulfolucanica intricata TaxID=1285191 RepID=UPI00082AD86C|nr:hypothetical protein [Desulfolucanica intricata]
MFKQIELHTGEGKYTVWLSGTVTADGLIIQLLGGEKPHVGAVVLTNLRPDSINGPKVKCNSTVVPRLGHREDEIAKPIAEEIAKKLRQTVVLTAGIHIDNATPEEIKILVDNCRKATHQFINKVKENETST